MAQCFDHSSLFTSEFELPGEEQLGGQREGHHEHGDVGRAKAVSCEVNQRATPQQQAHIKVELPHLQATHTLQEEDRQTHGVRGVNKGMEEPWVTFIAGENP